MKIESGLSDSAILEEVGERLARARLQHNLSQEEVADEAGVGVATLRRLEGGQPSRLDTFIRVLRVLDLVDGLEVALPAPSVSPVELLKLHGKVRQRAGRARGETRTTLDGGWVWGDEAGGK